jgi:hypothetical protein
MKLSNNLYDALKFLAQYVLPALGTLYFALSQIWGLPYADKIVGTILALDVFLGVIVSLSASFWNREKVAKHYSFKNDSNMPMVADAKSSWLADQLSKNVYDFLYWIGLILLPGLGTLYFALSKLWGFPYGEEIMGTIVALDAFLGVLLGVANAQYKYTMLKKAKTDFSI